MKRISLKLISAIAVVVLFTQVLTVRTNDVARADAIPTIRYANNWGGDDARGKAFNAALQQYSDAHKNSVQIVSEFTPGDEHRNKVMVDLAGNNLPDVVLWWTGKANLQPFVDGSHIVDMNEYLKLSKTIKKSQWSDSILTDSTMNGVLYALPVEAFKCFTLYNTDLFKKYNLKPPVSYADLKNVSKVFNDNGIVPIDTGSKGGNPGHLFYNSIVLQLKGGLDDDNALPTNPNVTTPAFEDATKVLSDMIHNKMFPSDTVANGDWGPSIALYNQQKAAMLFTCPWMIESISKDVAAVSDLMHFPTVDGSVLDPATFNVGGSVAGIVINKDAFNDPAKQAAIVDFVDFLLSDALANRMLTANISPAKNVTITPATQAALDPLYLKMVKFTSSEPNTYPVIGALLPGAASLNAYLDAMDKLFAGDPGDQVLSQLQDVVAKNKK